MYTEPTGTKYHDVFNIPSKETVWSTHDRILIMVKYAWWVHKIHCTFLHAWNGIHFKHLILCPRKTCCFESRHWQLVLKGGWGGLYTHVPICMCPHTHRRRATQSLMCLHIKTPQNDAEGMRNGGCVSGCSWIFPLYILFHFPKCLAMCIYHLFKIMFLKLSVIIVKFLAAQEYFIITALFSISQ